MSVVPVNEAEVNLCQSIYSDLANRPEVVTMQAGPPSKDPRMVGAIWDTAVLLVLPSLIHAAVNVAVGQLQKPVQDWEAAHAEQIREFLGDQVVTFLKAVVNGLPGPASV